MSDTISWRELWDETTRLHGRVHARWLCEDAAGAWGDDFDEVLTHPVTERSIAHLDAMLGRLHHGEPLQYVLGHWSFRHLDLLVDARVLIPRPETELVAEVAIERTRSQPRPWLCADLGTGSGAIGLSLLQELPRGAAEVTVLVDGVRTTAWVLDPARNAVVLTTAPAPGSVISIDYRTACY